MKERPESENTAVNYGMIRTGSKTSGHNEINKLLTKRKAKQTGELSLNRRNKG